MKSFLRTNFSHRHYAVITLHGKPKFCCFVNDEWIVDEHCKTIEQLIQTQQISISQIVGGYTHNFNTKH